MQNKILSDLSNNNQDRRTFLKSSLFGVIILTLGSSLSTSCTYYPPVSKKLKVFNNKEFLILSGIAEAFVAVNETPLPSPQKINIAYDIDEFISTVSTESKTQLKDLLNIFEDFTFLFNGSLKKFTSMSVSEKQKYLESWESSSLEFRQMAYSALKMFIMLVYYSKDETWIKIGYSGPYCMGGT